MTAPEFDEWQRAIAEAYAAEQVAAGRWHDDGAVERAREENLTLLPQGLHTPRMLILHGIDSNDQVIGRAWVGLDHPRGVHDAGFLYDIEVVEWERGKGLGRALLDAVEVAVRDAGAHLL